MDGRDPARRRGDARRTPRRNRLPEADRPGLIAAGGGSRQSMLGVGRSRPWQARYVGTIGKTHPRARRAQVSTNDGPGEVPPEQSPETTSVFRPFLSEPEGTESAPP